MIATPMDSLRDVGDDEDAARPAIDRLRAMGEMPTAIFAFNDLLAAGILDR